MGRRAPQPFHTDLLRGASLALAGVALALPVTAGFVALTAATLVGRSLLDRLRLAQRRRDAARGAKLA
jgi:hypothetical protein